MFIKQIIIQGFKSYKEQVVVGVLSPEHNVVVGHNGAGKSNLFSAIEFVLNGDKAFKQQKNRLSLLHEGVGPQVLSAHVEIIFDNSDGTFPIDSREVSLRRVISMKKDQFFLNKKTVTKQDAANFLGSAGLASCHPYYIVKQGKVTELAEASEAFHLELVKKVAGVRTCENRCNQTVNCFEGLSRRGEKVDRTIESITELKETLNGMSEELRKFQRLDKLKRGLHFVLSEKQLRAYEMKLRRIRAQLEEAGHSALGIRLHQAKENVAAASKQLLELKEQIRVATEKEDNLQLRISELRLERTRSQKHLDELKEGRNSRKAEKESIERDLQKAREDFAETERKLAGLQPELGKLQKNEERLSKEIQSLTGEVSIQTQHVRNKQYKTKEERNIAIEKTLEVLQLEIQNLKETASDRADEMRKMEETQVSLERDAVEQQERRATLKNMENSLSDLKSDVKKLKGEKIEILNKKTKEEQKLSTFRNKFEREERGFRSMASKGILDGINSVGRILEVFRQGNDGSKGLLADHYYGLVIDNFSCDEMVKTAVEVTAGGSLFHHIVATVQVANEILKEMNRLNLPGEVSFLPVESLILRPFSYPITQDALPLVSKLVFGNRFSKVYKKIFGSTFLCQSLDVAIELARRSRVDCVTFGGDQVSRHGWLMGGYVDPQRSRFKLYQARKAWLQQMEDIQEKIKLFEDELNEADKAYNEGVSNVAKKTLGIEVFKSDSQVISARLIDHQKLATLDRSLKERKESLDHIRILEETLTFKATKLEEELTQELPPVLPLDIEKCIALSRELMEIEGRRNAKLGELETKRNQERNLLEVLKDSSVERLKRDFEEIDLESEGRQIETSTSELESLSLLLLSTKEELKERRAGLQVLLEQERAQQLEFEKLETVKHSLSEEMKQALSQPKALQVDEVEYKQKIEALKRKIEEMGPVPNGVETFATWNTRKVLAELDKVKVELRGYEHVTMRALAPVADILRIVGETLLLVHQFRALFQSVSNSTRMSEQLKDHALRIAFRTVRRHFKEVFQRFVPNGQGKLRLIETSPPDVNSENRAYSIAGVLVKVSFTGGQPSQEMRQLSAGQKSVVALALIFAVQKCNPSPFYILDEIDHALDLHYRQTLALIVREMKAYSQFITITFRPELLQYADNFLGLKYCNKQSYICSLAKEEALKIVTKVQGTDR